MGKFASTTDISKSERKFARSLFDQVEEITGLTLKEDQYDFSEIILTGLLDSKRSSYTEMYETGPLDFVSFWDDDGTNSLTERDKIGLAQALMMPLGLKPINKKGGKYSIAGFAITKPNPKKIGTIAAINESLRVKD